MKTLPGTLLASKLELCSHSATLVIISLGCLGLAGWMFELKSLRSVFHGFPAMVPNTAVAFVLAGCSLWLLRAKRPTRAGRWAAHACGLAVTLIGLLTVAEYILTWDAGIDQLLFREALNQIQTPVPGRPAFLTALNCFLFGLALLLVDRGNRYANRPTELLTVAAMLISLLALIGYACNVPLFYGWRSLFPYTGMALHTLIGFLALGIGLLCARPERGLMEIVTSRTTSGLLARRLLLAPVIIPLVTGWLRIAGLRTGIYNAEFAAWLFAFLNLLIFTLAIWWSATLLYRAEIVRRNAEDEVRKANAELEQRVAQRTAALSQALKALEEQGGQMRLVLDTALDAVITIDSRGAVTDWNREAENTFGWSFQEVKGNKLSSTIIPLRYREAHERGLKHFLVSQEGPVLNRRVEITALHRDGREFPVELAVTPIPLGDAFMFSAFIRDISERKGAEAELERHRAELQLIFDSVPALIFFKDHEHRHLRVNEALARFLALSKKEIEGYTDKEMGAPHADLYYQDENEVIASGQAKRGIIEPVETCNGPRWLQTDKFPTRDERGQITGVIGFAIDITERKQVEEALRARDVAEAANRLKSEFLANMSHELRTPLNGVIGFVEFLIDEKPGALNSKQKEYLGDVRNSARHLLQLINDVLDLAKVEAGKMEINPGTFSLPTAIDEVCAVVKGIALKKQILLGVNISPGLRDVTIDEQKFKQVLYNLLSNAVKFTDPGGKVELLAAVCDPEHFQITVRDTGIGIKQEDLKRLFREFGQLDMGTARRFGGTGLGLVLTKKIVELHRGSITVESDFGSGSTFTVTFPFHATPAVNAATAEA